MRGGSRVVYIFLVLCDMLKETPILLESMCVARRHATAPVELDMCANVVQVGHVCKSQRQHSAPFRNTMVHQDLADFPSVGSRSIALNDDVADCMTAESAMSDHGSAANMEILAPCASPGS